MNTQRGGDSARRNNELTIQPPGSDARRYSDLSIRSPDRTLLLSDWLTQLHDSAERSFSNTITQEPLSEAMRVAPASNRGQGAVFEDEITTANTRVQVIHISLTRMGHRLPYLRAIICNRATTFFSHIPMS